MVEFRDLPPLIAATFFLWCAGSSLAPAQTALPDGSKIIVVRHADRNQKLSGDEVPLLPVGKWRALALAEALKGEGIAAIVTSNATRTRQTACPTAEALRLEPTPVRKPDMQATVRKLLPGTVLVVSHSEDIPDLVRSFSGKRVKIDGYDKVFTISGTNTGTRLVERRYAFRRGQGDAPPCPRPS